MHRRNHYVRAAAAVGLALIMIAVPACGGGGSGGGGSKIGSVLAGKQIPYYRDLAAGITAEAERQGWTSEVLFGDQTTPTQVNQVQNAVTSQPDGLIVGPIDQEALIPPYRAASDAGIPVVTVSDNIGVDGQQYQISYVGHKYEKVGRKKAQYIVDQLHGKGKVGIIHAIRGGNFTEQQNKGAMAVFAKHPGIQVIDGPYVGDFTPEVGLKGAEVLLAREPDLNALYFDSDDMAIGGVKALDERGIPQDTVIVVGTDGVHLDAVQSGLIDYTVSLCGYAQGVEAVKVLIDYIDHGTKPAAITETPQIEFTTQNVKAKEAQLTQEECR